MKNLFEERIEYLRSEGKIVSKSKPWRHFVVDDFLPEKILSKLEQDFIQEEMYRGIYKELSAQCIYECEEMTGHFMHDYFLEFIKKNEESVLEFFKKELQDEPDEDLEIKRIRYTEVANTPKEKYVREMHVDNPDKYFQSIFYMGDCTTGGNLWMSDKSKDSTAIIRYEFTRNRWIGWKNEEGTWHAFSSPVHGKRQTVCIPFERVEE